MNPFDAPLPGPLADPLHFPGASGGGWLPGLLMLLLWLLSLWWNRRRRPDRVERERPAPVTEPSATGGSPLDALDALRRRHLADQTYREGCHELAVLLRRHLERERSAMVPHLPWTRLTAREIRDRAGDVPFARLLSHLAGLRFGRAAPVREDFEHACRQVSDLVRHESHG